MQHGLARTAHASADENLDVVSPRPPAAKRARQDTSTRQYFNKPKTSLVFVLWNLLEFYVIIIHYFCLLLCLLPRVFPFYPLLF